MIATICPIRAVPIAVTRVVDVVAEDALTDGFVRFELLGVAVGRILVHYYSAVSVVAEEDALTILEKTSSSTTIPMAVEALFISRATNATHLQVDTAFVAIADDIGTAT